jgi:hypothetical protein
VKNFKKNNHGLSYRSPKLDLYFSWLAVRRYMRCVKKLRLFDYFLMACALPFILAVLIIFVVIAPLSFIFRFNFEKVTDPIVEGIGEVAEFTMNKIRDICLFFHCEGLLWRLFWSEVEWSDFEEEYPERARYVKLKTDNFKKWFELQSYKMPITKDVYDWYQKHTDSNFIREVEEKRKKRKKK